MHERTARRTSAETRALAAFARAVLREAFGGPPAVPPRDARTWAPGASFVTLHWPDGELQGCIGSLAPYRALAADVAGNALAAAFEDPRGRALSPVDLDDLDVEVSVLSSRTRIEFDGSEESARAALRPGVDGVVLSWRGRRGTFLPQVWASLPTPERFLDELKRKAGLPSTFWDGGVELERYTVDEAVDPAPHTRTLAGASA